MNLVQQPVMMPVAAPRTHDPWAHITAVLTMGGVMVAIVGAFLIALYLMTDHFFGLDTVNPESYTFFDWYRESGRSVIQIVLLFFICLLLAFIIGRM